MPTNPPTQPLKNPAIPRILVATLIVIMVALVAVGAWWWFHRTAAAPSSGMTNRSGATNQTIQTTTDASQGRSQDDTDGDGLTDAVELGLGTNPTLKDTDRDGLTDYDEVKLYHSDPLKADTDGDGINDGTEVQRGFDPAGPGKLFERKAPAPTP